MNSKTDNFKEYSLYPALWQRIPDAFPEMEFVMRGGYWRSPKHIDGSSSHSSDQTFIHYKRKDLIKDNADSRAYSLIDFEMKRSGSDFWTAFKRLCDLCGLTPPSEDTDEYRAYKEQQENREAANSRFVDALWSGSKEANAVLAYLREVRRWTDKQIRDAELGYVDAQILAQLPDKSEFDFSTKDGDRIGSTHRLTIPYRNGGRIFGFKVRDIAKQGGLKYLNTKGLSKSAGLFGIGIGVKDITIVEGELDALHAKVMGADYVVATTGSAAGEQQIADAMKRGCKRFTLLFDNDERGRSFIASTIATIEKQGGEAFVAELPDDVKDTDEYLTRHSIKEWEDNVKEAYPATVWKYYRILDKYVALCRQQDNTITLKQREDYFAEVGALMDAPTTKAHNREYIFDLMRNDEATLHFRVDDVRAFFDKAYLRAKEAQRTAETQSAALQAVELSKEGKTDEALKLMRETANKQGMQERETEYAKVFAPDVPAKIESYLSEIPGGIPTGYTFKQKRQEEPLTLNPGLTFICGYRGHGKTSFLNNIALNEAKRNIRLQNGKSVLYFSYEVDKRRLITDLLGTFVNDKELNNGKNPQDAIVSYFKGESRWISKKPMTGRSLTHLQNFEQKKAVFLRDYLSSGALVVVEENYKVERLLDAIRYYLTISKPSIICIDYAQLIYSEDYSRLRTEEIKKVVNDIKDFANKNGIPFVIAAQFNREVYSPVSVDTKNIGEGGDFERIADTCIGLFNLKELKPIPGRGKEEEKEAKELVEDLWAEYIRQIPEEKERKAEQMKLDEFKASTSLRAVQNKLFVRLMKRRYGYYPLDVLIEWEGRTKYITPNDPEALTRVADEQSLFEDELQEAPEEDLFVSEPDADAPF